MIKKMSNRAKKELPDREIPVGQMKECERLLPFRLAPQFRTKLPFYLPELNIGRTMRANWPSDKAKLLAADQNAMLRELVVENPHEAIQSRVLLQRLTEAEHFFQKEVISVLPRKSENLLDL